MLKNLLLVLLIIGTSSILAQDRAELIFRDGSSLEGLAKINKKDEVVFRKTSNDKRTVYNHRQIKELVIFKDSLVKTYNYKMVNKAGKGNQFQLLRKPIIKGKVNLYYKMKKVSYNNFHTPIGVTGPPFLEVYYLSKDQENSVTYLHTAKPNSRKFKKIAEEYFSDCPELMSKINANEFKAVEFSLKKSQDDGIIQIVNYYNDKCFK